MTEKYPSFVDLNELTGHKDPIQFPYFVLLKDSNNDYRNTIMQNKLKGRFWRASVSYFLTLSK